MSCLRNCFAAALASAAIVGSSSPAVSADRPEFVQDGVYVTLQGTNAVGPLFGDAEWAAGDQMTYVAVDPDGELVMAASSAENAVYAYNAADGELLAKIPVGDTPKGIRFDRDGRYAFAANEGSGTISVIDAESSRS
jgi:DNA-binding beta-propeller fold protein YncE